jgi:WD40 repeat protein
MPLSPHPGEHFTRLSWLPRATSTLLTASSHGILRLFDLASGLAHDPLLFQMSPPPLSSPLDFQTTMIHYNRDVNLVFAGSRDGRFGIWQFPERWRSQELEDMEREYEQARKMMMKVRAA